MKNILVASLIFLLSPLLSHAQDGGEAYGEGKIIVSAGYGAPNFGKTVLRAVKDLDSDEFDYTVSGIGPAHVKAEYGITDKISGGLSFNYVSCAANWKRNEQQSNGTVDTYTDKISYTGYSINARMNLHFATSEKLDAYWGIGAGYASAVFKISSNDPDFHGEDIKLPNLAHAGFETTFGMRYYFTPNIGCYGEVGYAKSVGQLGIVVKF
jgi:opacity protein-like surface antigen